MRLRCIALVVLMASIVVGAVPRIMSFQARLTDGEGVPIEGTETVDFRVHYSEEGGDPIWTESHNIAFEDGLCSVILGSVEPFTLDFGDDYWLEIEVDGEVLAPRYRLTTSPYAFRADMADTAHVALYAMEAIYAQYADTSEFAYESEYAEYADTADFAENSHYAVMATYASLSDSSGRAYTADEVSWDDITDMPAGFADGIDDTGSGGGSYSAGEGIAIDDDEISVADAGITVDKLADMDAEDGQILKYTEGTGWTAQQDDVTDGWGDQSAYTDESIEGDGTVYSELGIADGGVLETHIADYAVSLDKLSPAGSSPGQVIKNVGGELVWAEDEEGSGGTGGDDWGDDVVNTYLPLDGDGTLSSPLYIASGGITGDYIGNNAIGEEHIQNDAVLIEHINPSGPDGFVMKIRDGAMSWSPDSTYADNWGIQSVVTGDGLLGIGVEGNELSIGDYMIEPIKIDPTDADPGQILKYDGVSGQVIWADDETGGGGVVDDEDWTIDGVDLTTGRYVGIGTIPLERLHIYDDSSVRILVQSLSHAELMLDAPVTNNGRITFATSMARNGSIEWDGPGNGMAFYHGPVSATPDLFIADPGWLGIGTEFPTQPLHVAGNVHIEGNLTVDGTYPGGGGGGIGGSGTDNYIPRWNGTDALENSGILANDDGSIEIETATSSGYVAKFTNTGTGIKSGIWGEGTGGIGIYGKTASDSPTYAGVSANSTGAAPGLRASAGTGLAGKFNGDVEVDGVIKTDVHTSPATPIAFGYIGASGTILSATSNVTACNYDTDMVNGYSLTVSTDIIQLDDHIIMVTPVGPSAVIASVWIAGGKAIFFFYDYDAGSYVQSSFYFVIYRL